MKVQEIFRSKIDRRIEEVVKVDLAEERLVAEEIEEYVVTGHIAERFETVLDRYQETILKPDEGTNVWVSGFFGSGKSSFAKFLGYLLANPTVDGTSVAERFRARTNATELHALLNTIHTQAPTRAVFVDLSTGKDVLNEGESIVLPLYRALLNELGYSRNPLLAELEFDLESDGHLDDFIEAFNSRPGAMKTWEERRGTGLARSEASHAMHLLWPDTYPHADSWARSAHSPSIDANWFADRALELLERRGDGARRLVFVVDEVGQYVARSVQRILDLQGLAEAVQKQRGRLWLVVTSQETLGDVVSALEGKQIELARLQARFPVRVDLLPADIDEVVGIRVLDKNAPGGRAVRETLSPHKNKLASNIRLTSPSRAEDLAEDDFVRLYPLLHYQVRLLIHAISARRAQGGAAPMLGGSNRTLIKLAQQLIVDPKVGLHEHGIGALVTLDRAYDLLESIIPTATQAEIRAVTDRYRDAGGMEAAVAKTITLCMDVPDLPLDSANLAVLLHPAIGAESQRDDVARAIQELLNTQVIRRKGDGYQIQSPEQRTWEQERADIDPRPANLARLRRELLRDELTSLSVTEGRTFNVEVSVEGDKQVDGEIPLLIEEADADRLTALRTQSRDPAADAKIWWVYQQTPETEHALKELFRSGEMISRYQHVPSRAESKSALVNEELQRQRDLQRQAVVKIAEELLGGQVVFRGRAEEPVGTGLKLTAQQIVRSRIREIYPRLGQFAAQVPTRDVLAVLRTDDLRGLPAYLREDGIGLLRSTPSGVELATDTDPLAVVVSMIAQRANYGNEATGAYLEQFFGKPPFGAPVEVVRLLVAAAIRVGQVEAVHQGAHIRRPSDGRLDRVLGTLPPFRASSFIPQSEGVDLPTRVKVAGKLSEHLGERPPSPAVEVLAPLLRKTFASDREAADQVRVAWRSLGLPLPDAVARTSDITSRIVADDDNDTVRTAAHAWADLISGTNSVRALNDIVTKDLDALRKAVDERQSNVAGLGEEAAADHAALCDLLDSGNLADHFAEIKARTSRIAMAREAARGAALEQLQNAVAEERGKLSTDFADLGETQVTEAIRQLNELVPANAESWSPEALNARYDAVDHRAAAARRELEQLQEAGQLVHVDVRRLAPTPIATEEQLEIVVDRIRETVDAELGQGKKVKLS